jgi:hypothetical protein
MSNRLADEAAYFGAYDDGKEAAAEEIAALRRQLGEILAAVFRDGGHRQTEIADDAKAVKEACEVVSSLQRRCGEISSKSSSKAGAD